MNKFTELHRAEEYYRPGVWKIFYRLAGVDYIIRGTNYQSGLPYEFDGGSDEIKFPGKDAAERSLAVLEAMKLEE